MIDSSDRENVFRSKKILWDLLNDSPKVPIVIIVNKLDLGVERNVMDLPEVIEKFDLQLIKDREWTVVGTSMRSEEKGG